MNSIEAACTVPGTHSSIQQAVDDLACDDVTLTKDSYLESVTISRSLSLTGAPSLIEGEITITGDNTAVAVDGISIVALFSDGFESGDLSAWSDTVP